ncbi:hypothetical protein CW745_11065 [Psychromonas sp. psych-6C06]|uniref:SPOR domain-containing protein n=1 Tax=Psychromonas sp. psych-6C06 TaxID=2058089 RepID=UPI000C3495E6|nr:SPOR domain-containing protein [Psychromonas sp. psych-6C06]PKF61167.1 hypothetical protein CW745_11065 [Psychromonas sp. psych-6C06]
MNFLGNKHGGMEYKASLVVRLCISLCLLFSTFMCVAADTKASNEADAIIKSDTSATTLDDVKALLDQQIAEWNEMKPALKRLIQSEKDLALIIDALDKTTPVASSPSDQQLLESPSLTLPIASKKTSDKQEKVATINPITIKNKVDIALAADSEKTVTTTVQIGVHLASYQEVSNVEPGWKMIKKRYNQWLGDKTPFYYQMNVGQQVFTRLVVGPFNSEEHAKEACQLLQQHQQYCQAVSYKVLSKSL